MSDTSLPGTPVPARSISQTPAMISVVQTLYFHPASGSGETEQFDNRYSQILAEDEHPYVRTVQYDSQKWHPLECGWIDPEKCSCLVVEHLTKPPFGRPVAGDEGTVEIGVAVESDRSVTPIMSLSPGTSLRFAPVDLRMLRLTCREGSARCKLIILPK